MKVKVVTVFVDEVETGGNIEDAKAQSMRNLQDVLDAPVGDNLGFCFHCMAEEIEE